MRVVRARLARRDRRRDRRAARRGRASPTPREIFVLTRTRKESQSVADALAARGVPAVLAARRASTRPTRRATSATCCARSPIRTIPRKRLRAWLTPFFALSLADLPAAAAGADQPLRRSPARLARRRRERRSGRACSAASSTTAASRGASCSPGDAMRRLTNFQQLFELLAADAARAGAAARRPRAPARRRWSRGWSSPQPEEGNMLRAEGDRDAVQIMTMHRPRASRPTSCSSTAASAPAPATRCAATSIDGQRRRAGGPAAPAGDHGAAQARSRRRGPAPLLRRADARAQAALPAVLGQRPRRGRVAVRRRHAGGVLEARRRLPARQPPRCASCSTEPDTRRLLDPHEIRDRRARRRRRRPPAATAGARRLASRPGRRRADRRPTRRSPALRRARAGAVTTSYSRIKQAHGGYRPPTEMLDEVAAPRGRRDDGDDDELPGGARAGIFLHALLEKLPLETLRETPALDAWSARDDVRALTLSRCCAGTGAIRATSRPAPRLAHAALTAPLPVVGGALPGWRTRRARRARWSSCSRSRPRRAAPSAAS